MLIGRRYNTCTDSQPAIQSMPHHESDSRKVLTSDGWNALQDAFAEEKHQSEGRDEATATLGGSLANRDRFRKNPLWIDIEADPKSRAATSHNAQLPRHVNEVLRVENAPQPAPYGPNPGRQRNPARKDARFMASSPVNDNSSAKTGRDQIGPRVERTGFFMTASCKYAPDGKLLQKQSKHDKGITIKSVAVLNNTV